jgi:hypothetical protein
MRNGKKPRTNGSAKKVGKTAKRRPLKAKASNGRVVAENQKVAAPAAVTAVYADMASALRTKQSSVPYWPAFPISLMMRLWWGPPGHRLRVQ